MAVLQLKAGGLHSSTLLPQCHLSSLHVLLFPLSLTLSPFVFVIFHHLSMFANLRPFSAPRLNSSSPLGSCAEGYRNADREKMRSKTIIKTDREGERRLPFCLSLLHNLSLCVLFLISAYLSLSISIFLPCFLFGPSSSDPCPFHQLLPVISALTPLTSLFLLSSHRFLHADSRQFQTD